MSNGPTMYFDNDADLSALAGKKIAIIVLPVAGATYYPGLTAFNGTAADNPSGVREVYWQLRWDSSSGPRYWNYLDAWSGNPGIWKWAEGTTAWRISTSLPAVWPQQSYTLLVRIYDQCGNSTQLESAFRIGDYAPPTITSISASPSVLSSVNGKLVAVTVTVAATDAIDPAPVSRITGVTCNETIPSSDWSITGPLTVKLRASRNTSRAPRIYTIHVSCTDASGNASTGTATVTIPVKTKR